MAALSVGRNHTILTFSDVSIIVTLTDELYSERMLEHKSSCAKDETENSEVNVPIVCSSLSNKGCYFSCCIYKDLYLWCTKDWNLVSKRQVHRSASAILFSPNDEAIVVADKSGDVYLFSAENPEKEGCLILGHISMLLDFLITPCGKYIITSDRDEKIRVSCFPNAYNIQSFCLGHEEFVTSLNIMPHNEAILISGSGDGTLRFWDYESGKQLNCHDCSESESEYDANNKPIISKLVSLKCSERESILCVQLVTFKGILVYSISSDKNINEIKCVFKHIITMDSEPWCLCITGVRLWVLKQKIEECLSTYNFCNVKNEFILDNSMTSIQSMFKKHSVLLENVFKKDRHLKTLYKRRFDNVQEYLKRKMMRMETDTKKSKTDLSIPEIT